MEPLLRSRGPPRTLASRPPHWPAIETWRRLRVRERTSMPIFPQVTSSVALTVCLPPAAWIFSAFANPTPAAPSAVSVGFLTSRAAGVADVVNDARVTGFAQVTARLRRRHHPSTAAAGVAGTALHAKIPVEST